MTPFCFTHLVTSIESLKLASSLACSRFTPCQLPEIGLFGHHCDGTSTAHLCRIFCRPNPDSNPSSSRPRLTHANPGLRRDAGSFALALPIGQLRQLVTVRATTEILERQGFASGPLAKRIPRPCDSSRRGPARHRTVHRQQPCARWAGQQSWCLPALGRHLGVSIGRAPGTRIACRQATHRPPRRSQPAGDNARPVGASLLAITHPVGASLLAIACGGKGAGTERSIACRQAPDMDRPVNRCSDVSSSVS